MSDERRAEIEAVARSFGYRPSKPHQTVARQEQWQRGLRLAANAIDALDRLRDARGDDEVRGQMWGDPPAARSPQAEDHEAVKRYVRGWLEHWNVFEGHSLAAQEAIVREFIAGFPSRVSAPKAEDHEAGIEAALKVAHEGPLNACNMGSDMCETRPEVRNVIAAYLARVSAPKADEKQEASLNDERRH